MILHGNQRGGYKDLAIHLTKPENERVTLHSLRGFVSDDLAGAFQESYAISKGTKCKQHLFSLSLNPPKHADVSDQDFEHAADLAEKRLGLTGQPRAIVFHDKRGEDGELRRHAHAVWCRINTEHMKAVQLSYTHKTLRQVSRDLFIAHQWRMPDGLINSRDRDVHNMSLAEWQQAKRAGANPKDLKSLFQDCWARSDGRAAFASALAEQGYVLAQGNRGHVVVDHKGEVYPVSRWVGLKAKEVRARLGAHDHLPDVRDAQMKAATIIAERVQELRAQETQSALNERRRAAEKKKRLLAQQARDAARLRESQAKRQMNENAQRDARLRTGVMGFVDRLTGRRKRVIAENDKDAALRALRDRREIASAKHSHDRSLRQHLDQAKSAARPHKDAMKELSADIRWLRTPPELAPQREDRSTSERKPRPKRQRRARSRDGPAPER